MTGRLTVITGPMWSGKTTELIARLNAERARGQTVRVIVPDIEGVWIHSRNGGTWTDVERVDPGGLWLYMAKQIPEEEISPGITYGIEEAQFFRKSDASFINEVRKQNRVSFVISGLSRDYGGAPFGPIPTLLGMADEIVQKKAICDCCKSYDGTRTVRNSEDKQRVLIGSEGYGVRCHLCADL